MRLYGQMDHRNTIDLSKEFCFSKSFLHLLTMPAKIKWKLIEIRAGDLKPNPDNPKKRDEKGFGRLQKALAKFGKVFTAICNKDLTIIDGHSRTELTDPDEIVMVFVPSRQLTPKEYKEMNAVYDLSRAGDIDMQILEAQFTEEFFDEWDVSGDKKNIVSFEAKPPTNEWWLNIKCKNERECKRLYERLSKEGLTVKIIT